MISKIYFLVERKKEADMKFQTYSHVEDEISINFELESLTGISTDEWNGTVSIEISSFDGRSQSTPFYPGSIYLIIIDRPENI